MGQRSKNFSEKAFQDNFVLELQKYKWQAPEELDGTTHKVTVQDLVNHWRSELNRINADKLEGVPLTDNEFKQVMAKVRRINNSYEAAKLLAIEESTGKIDGIRRDQDPRITREQITLTIFKKAEVRGGDSSYKIAREVRTNKGNRFDIIMLINGLPLINIEQKRTDQNLEEAFGQFKRYYSDGEFTNTFMAFSQMMVITSEIDTRYFATPKSYQDFNSRFVFRWANKDNKPVTNWKEVIKHFLMIPMAHQMVGDYLIIDEARHEEDQRHMLMRPYQVHALQAVEAAAMGWDNDGFKHGGFVWHTTGSGKTITSFKTALFLSTRAGFDKVIFLVDRRELDSKTSEKFKAYASYEAVSVDDTAHTYQLKKQLRMSKRGIIVTTTFKLHNFVKELIENDDRSLADKSYIFIIDEAHRTTMGQMMGTIKNYFKKNSLFYGFTGTPLFDESNVPGKINEKSEVIDTTEKLFGPMLHQYTIDEAIADGNVLGFHVDYINTGEFKNHDDLRLKLVEKIIEDAPTKADIEVERMVASWDDAKVEKEAYSKGLYEYYDKTHIPRVVTKILDNWNYQSQNRQFNAILTVAYKERVLAYYHEFKKQLKERDAKLNIAMTVSFGNENDPENIIDIDVIKEMFKDYAAFTGIEFISGDRRQGERAYFEDLVDRSTQGGSGHNSKYIDLVIVADQLLTGYDSKRLNTLYVDRSLELHGLIQAYSRTNRILDSAKEFGTIINFKHPAQTEETVAEALKLYGSGGSSSKAIVDTYEVAIEKLDPKIGDLKRTLPDPTQWALIKDLEERKELFFLAFKEAAEQLNKVQQYYQFKWYDLSYLIDEHTWLQYVGAYKNLKKESTQDDEDDPVLVPPLVSKTQLVGSQVIDAAHIIKLIGEKVKPVGDVQTVDKETLRIIHEQIQELSNMGEDTHARLIKEFVDTELVVGNVPTNMHFDEAFENWKNSRLQKEVQAFADYWGVDAKQLLRSLKSYSSTKPGVVPYIDDLIKTVRFQDATNSESSNQIEHNIMLTNELPTWMAETEEKYS